MSKQDIINMYKDFSIFLVIDVYRFLVVLLHLLKNNYY